MRRYLAVFALSVLGPLMARATPVTEITGGFIVRTYSGIVSETDYLDINGPDFRAILGTMTDSVPNYFQTPFTDHVSAGVIWLPGWPNCPSCDPILGTLTLDVTTYLSVPIGFYPGPDQSTGIFTAVGTFTAPGVDIPLTGGGTTSVILRTRFDPDPGYYFYVPGSISYNFVPAPEPALAIPTGLAILALILARTRAGKPGAARPDVTSPATESL